METKIEQLEEVVRRASEILSRHEEGAEMNAGFDAGEFSGPSHAEQVENEIEALAKVYGFSGDEVWRELMRQANELELCTCDPVHDYSRSECPANVAAREG